MYQRKYDILAFARHRVLAMFMFLLFAAVSTITHGDQLTLVTGKVLQGTIVSNTLSGVQFQSSNSRREIPWEMLSRGTRYRFQPGFKKQLTALLEGNTDTIAQMSPTEPAAVNTIEPSQLAPVSNGLTGEYFSTVDLEALVETRIDPNIDFMWGGHAPSTNMPADQFSVRWTGQIIPEHSGTYTFYIVVDDGARLWIDDALLIDAWQQGAKREVEATVDLEAGHPHKIKATYFDVGGTALIYLFWSSADQPKELVPSKNLQPRAVPSR